MNPEQVKRLEQLLIENSSLLTEEGSERILNFARNPDAFFASISALSKDGIYSFRGRVTKSGSVRVIPKPDKELKLLKFEVSDGSGNVTVNLWNNEIEYYGNLIVDGNLLSFVDCRLTINNYGSQISLGDRGFIISATEP